MTQEIDQPREIPQGAEHPKVPEWKVVSRENDAGKTIITLGSNLDLDDIQEPGDNCELCRTPMQKAFLDWSAIDFPNSPNRFEMRSRVPGYICGSGDDHLPYFDERSLISLERAAAAEFRGLGETSTALSMEQMAKGMERVANLSQAHLS